MNRRASSSASGPIRRALSGALFPVFFLAGEAVAGQLATDPPPMPDAPVAEVVAYYGGSRTAALVLGGAHALAAAALLAVGACVVLFLRRTLAHGDALAGLARWGGVLAGLFLLASALLTPALTQAAGGSDLAFVGTLRSPRVYRFLLTTHIITSVGWLGVVFAKLVLALAAATAASPDVSAALLVALGTINAAFAPASTGAIVSGVLLSLGTRWGLLQHSWVVAKLVLTVGVFGTAVQIVPRIVDLGVDEPTLLGLPWAPAILLVFAALHLLMLGAATTLAVYKPWGKTWFGRRPDARRRPEATWRGTGTASPVRLDAPGSVERVA
jgi:hypothetical protein